MKLYYFKDAKTAKSWGLEYPESNFKKFGVFAIVHKKKVVSVLMRKNNWLGFTYKERPERTCEVITQAIMQLIKKYPELGR